MTYHHYEMQISNRPVARSARLDQIYRRSLRARTAKEKAALWTEQPIAINPQSGGNPRSSASDQ